MTRNRNSERDRPAESPTIQPPQTKSQIKSPPRSPLFVGIGASIGGLDAFVKLLRHLRDPKGLAVVYVQHADPQRDGKWIETVKVESSLPIVELKERTKLKAGHVYVAPSNTVLEVKNAFIHIVSENGDPRPSAPIDHFLHSLAEDQAERSVGIILSGSGSDGTLGLKAIGDHGGLTFAQDSESAQFDSMPRSAAITGAADYVLPPAEIAAELTRYQEHIYATRDRTFQEKTREAIGQAIPDITERLLKVTNHNFQHYKSSTLSRRIHRRMQVLKLGNVEDYLQLLKQNDDEAHSLFRELLIGVTTFFRDPDAFEAVSEMVLPNLFEGRSADDTVRLWVAGCASGEEAYSMAMLCREYMDSLENPPSVRVFATDIDQRALQIARQGIYTIGIEDDVSPERLKRFFVRRGKRYQVSKEIRDLVLFSPHNLISDPPFSRQDLISCRNLLIYLGSHLQNKLIPLFHYALRPSGYLLLGPSENISSHGDLFKPLHSKFRISQRKGTAIGTSAALTYRSGGLEAVNSPEPESENSVDLTNLMQKIILDEFSPKSVVIDETGQILVASSDMQKYLSISSGRFQNNIIKLAKSGLRIGLRATLSEAKLTRRKVHHENLTVKVGDAIQSVMLTVQPMPMVGEEHGIFLVVFQDVGLPVIRDDNGEFLQPRSTVDDRDADSIIAQMERELETTRRDLEKTMQEMETANEELKSSNEELLSMNEELQSANEELETSKEEIRIGSDAIARANNDLENLLRSTQIATIFLDEELNIRSFTPPVTEIYDLIPTDIGRPLARFMPLVQHMPELPDPSALKISEPVEHLIVAHSGKSFIRRVLPYQSHTGGFEGVVVTFSDVTDLRESENRLAMALDAASNGSWDWYIQTNRVILSDQWISSLGYERSETVPESKFWRSIVHPDDMPLVEQELQKHFAGEVEKFYCEYRLRTKSGEYRWNLGRGRVVERDATGAAMRMVGTDTDITLRKLGEQKLKENERRLAMALRAGGLAAWEWTPTSTYWTDELYELMGVPRETEPTSELFFSYIIPEDLPAVREAWRSMMEGSESFEVEFQIKRPDGETRWLVGVGETMRDSDGKVTHVYGLNWDSTKEHVAAETLKESERKAKQASLSKSEFLANMSHEIRTPMTAILGYADLLVEGVSDEAKLQHYQTIRRNGDFLLQIINDILDLSKIEANKVDVERARFKPNHLVEDVRSIMEVRAKECDLDLVVDYRGKIPSEIISDPKRIKQILINLIGNAVKFTEEGGVEVVVEYCEREQPQLRFDVIDTGIGMNEQQRNSLFQPFSQGDSSVNRKFGGTGLGLAISKRLATMLGGTITVESEPGKGSKFSVTIATGDISDVDFVTPSIVTESPELEDDQAEVLLDCRVLVVDDRREIRFLSQRLLAKAGAKVSEAEDGELAVEAVRRSIQEGPSFDLILLDMQMPKLDGYATAKKLREIGFEKPIIALTADAMQGDMSRCIKSGCNAYLSKPIDTRRLLQLVAQHTKGKCQS